MLGIRNVYLQCGSGGLYQLWGDLAGRRVFPPQLQAEPGHRLAESDA